MKYVKHILFKCAHAAMIMAFAAVNSLSSQNVTTYAGVQYTDSGRFLGTADNPKNNELYSRPLGIAVDNNGRIWVTDEHNMMLLDGNTSRNRGGYRGDPTSSQSMGYFDGTSTASRFTYPAGIAVHPTANDVYFCDRDNSSIRKGSKFVNSSSGTIFSTYAGYSDWSGGYVDGKLTDARFRFPEDAQYDDSGILYICDFMNHCIRKISGGNVTTLAGDGSQSAGYTDATGKSARFSFPSGIGMDTNGDLLVADRNNRCIRRINTQTAAVTTVTKDVNFPYDVIGVNGKIYILEPTCIKVFDGKTVKVFAGSTSNSGYKDGSIQEARFGQMFHFDYNPIDQCLYVADYGNNVIRRIPLNLEVTSDFVANNTNPIVNQTVVLSSKAQNQESQTWEITPSSYVLQAGSKLTDRIVYVSFSNAASYSVKLTAKNPSGQAVATKENYINVSTNSLAKPVADFTVTNTYPTLTVETVRLVDLSANNPTSFEWTITPNTFTFQNSTNAQSRNPEVKFNALGLYTLSLNVQNANGSDVETKTNFIKVVGLNTQTQQTRNVYVYPNPSNGQVFIKGLSIGSQIQVLDMNGRLILSQESNSESISLELTQGMYFIQAYSEGTWQSLGKVIITPY